MDALTQSHAISALAVLTSRAPTFEQLSTATTYLEGLKARPDAAMLGQQLVATATPQPSSSGRTTCLFYALSLLEAALLREDAASSAGPAASSTPARDMLLFTAAGLTAADKLELPHAVQTKLSALLASAAERDFPQRWHSMADQLVCMLGGQSVLAMETVARALADVLADCAEADGGNEDGPSGPDGSGSGSGAGLSAAGAARLPAARRSEVYAGLVAVATTVLPPLTGALHAVSHVVAALAAPAAAGSPAAASAAAASFGAAPQPLGGQLHAAWQAAIAAGLSPANEGFAAQSASAVRLASALLSAVPALLSLYPSSATRDTRAVDAVVAIWQALAGRLSPAAGGLGTAAAASAATAALGPLAPLQEPCLDALEALTSRDWKHDSWEVALPASPAAAAAAPSAFTSAGGAGAGVPWGFAPPAVAFSAAAGAATASAEPLRLSLTSVPQADDVPLCLQLLSVAGDACARIAAAGLLTGPASVSSSSPVAAVRGAISRCSAAAISRLWEPLSQWALKEAFSPAAAAAAGAFAAGGAAASRASLVASLASALPQLLLPLSAQSPQLSPAAAAGLAPAAAPPDLASAFAIVHALRGLAHPVYPVGGLSAAGSGAARGGAGGDKSHAAAAAPSLIELLMGQSLSSTGAPASAAAGGAGAGAASSVGASVVQSTLPLLIAACVKPPSVAAAEGRETRRRRAEHAASRLGAAAGSASGAGSGGDDEDAGALALAAVCDAGCTAAAAAATSAAGSLASTGRRSGGLRRAAAGDASDDDDGDAEDEGAGTDEQVALLFAATRTEAARTLAAFAIAELRPAVGPAAAAAVAAPGPATSAIVLALQTLARAACSAATAPLTSSRSSVSVWAAPLQAMDALRFLIADVISPALGCGFAEKGQEKGQEKGRHLQLKDHHSAAAVVAAIRDLLTGLLSALPAPAAPAADAASLAAAAPAFATAIQTCRLVADAVHLFAAEAKGLVSTAPPGAAAAAAGATLASLLPTALHHVFSCLEAAAAAPAVKNSRDLAVAGASGLTALCRHAPTLLLPLLGPLAERAGALLVKAGPQHSTAAAPAAASGALLPSAVCLGLQSALASVAAAVPDDSTSLSFLAAMLRSPMGVITAALAAAPAPAAGASSVPGGTASATATATGVLAWLGVPPAAGSVAAASPGAAARAASSMLALAYACRAALSILRSYSQASSSSSGGAAGSASGGVRPAMRPGLDGVWGSVLPQLLQLATGLVALSQANLLAPHVAQCAALPHTAALIPLLLGFASPPGSIASLAAAAEGSEAAAAAGGRGRAGSDDSDAGDGGVAADPSARITLLVPAPAAAGAAGTASAGVSWAPFALPAASLPLASWSSAWLEESVSVLVRLLTVPLGPLPYQPATAASAGGVSAAPHPFVASVVAAATDAFLSPAGVLATAPLLSRLAPLRLLAPAFAAWCVRHLPSMDASVLGSMRTLCALLADTLQRCQQAWIVDRRVAAARLAAASTPGAALPADAAAAEAELLSTVVGAPALPAALPRGIGSGSAATPQLPAGASAAGVAALVASQVAEACVKPLATLLVSADGVGASTAAAVATLQHQAVQAAERCRGQGALNARIDAALSLRDLCEGDGLTDSSAGASTAPSNPFGARLCGALPLAQLLQAKAAGGRASDAATATAGALLAAFNAACSASTAALSDGVGSAVDAAAAASAAASAADSAAVGGAGAAAAASAGLLRPMAAPAAASTAASTAAASLGNRKNPAASAAASFANTLFVSALSLCAVDEALASAAGRLLRQCLRDAGAPPAGDALEAHRRSAGQARMRQLADAAAVLRGQVLPCFAAGAAALASGGLQSLLLSEVGAKVLDTSESTGSTGSGSSASDGGARALQSSSAALLCDAATGLHVTFSLGHGAALSAVAGPAAADPSAFAGAVAALGLHVMGPVATAPADAAVAAAVAAASRGAAPAPAPGPSGRDTLASALSAAAPHAAGLLPVLSSGSAAGAASAAAIQAQLASALATGGAPAALAAAESWLSGTPAVVASSGAAGAGATDAAPQPLLPAALAAQRSAVLRALLRVTRRCFVAAGITATGSFGSAAGAAADGGSSALGFSAFAAGAGAGAAAGGTAGPGSSSTTGSRRVRNIAEALVTTARSVFAKGGGSGAAGSGAAGGTQDADAALGHGGGLGALFGGDDL